MNIERVLAPEQKDIDVIFQGLVNFNETYVPNIRNDDIALFVRNTDGKINGGAIAKMLGDCLFVEYFWLSEEIRKVGLGSLIVERLIKEARNHKLHGIYLDTYSFQAAGFYQSLGFREEGRFTDFPVKGVDKIFMCKRVAG